MVTLTLPCQPSQANFDFDRAQHVANLPKGEETVIEKIEDLREKVEQVSPKYLGYDCAVSCRSSNMHQARLLSYRLALAEKQVDRRLAVARQRKTEVGFVKDVLTASNRTS